MNTSACRGCGKKIVWGMTVEGKKIPLDAVAPTYRIVPNVDWGDRIVRSEAMVSHFATCSKANDFSASKKS